MVIWSLSVGLELVALQQFPAAHPAKTSRGCLVCGGGGRGVNTCLPQLAIKTQKQKEKGDRMSSRHMPVCRDTAPCHSHADTHTGRHRDTEDRKSVV